MKRNIKNYGFVVVVAVLTSGFFGLAVSDEKYRSAFADLAKDVIASYVAGVAANQTSGRKEN